MQRKVIAIGRLGDDLAGRVMRVERHREAFRALDQLHREIAARRRRIEIGTRGFQHLMIGDIGRADLPGARADVIAPGIRVAHDEAALLELAQRSMQRGPGDAERGGDVGRAAGRHREVLQHLERAAHALERGLRVILVGRAERGDRAALVALRSRHDPRCSVQRPPVVGRIRISDRAGEPASAKARNAALDGASRSPACASMSASKRTPLALTRFRAAPIVADTIFKWRIRAVSQSATGRRGSCGGNWRASRSRRSRRSASWRRRKQPMRSSSRATRSRRGSTST